MSSLHNSSISWPRIVCFVALLACSNVLAFNYSIIRSEISDTGLLVTSMGGCGNMAIGWVRTVFHDFATYDAKKRTGGIDGSILTTEEASLPDNGAIHFGGNIAFFRHQALVHNTVSAADWIVLGAIVGLRVCGGPDLRGRFRPGRVDKFIPNDHTLLPDFRWSLARLSSAFQRMNLTQDEYLTLVLGSHSLGGANMTVGSIGFGQSGQNGKPFDDTPTKFDNSIFKRGLNRPLVLDSDRELMKSARAPSIAQLYANNQTAFFVAYGNAFMKMVDMGHTNLGCRLDSVGCTKAQMTDSPIPNPLKTMPTTWEDLPSEIDKAPIGEQQPNAVKNNTLLEVSPLPDSSTPTAGGHKIEHSYIAFLVAVIAALCLVL